MEEHCVKITVRVDPRSFVGAGDSSIVPKIVSELFSGLFKDFVSESARRTVHTKIDAAIERVNKRTQSFMRVQFSGDAVHLLRNLVTTDRSRTTGQRDEWVSLPSDTDCTIHTPKDKSVSVGDARIICEQEGCRWEKSRCGAIPCGGTLTITAKEPFGLQSLHSLFVRGQEDDRHVRIYNGGNVSILNVLARANVKKIFTSQ